MDRLVNWIDQLPGPSGVMYAFALLVAVVFNHWLFWIEGPPAVGAVFSLLARVMVYADLRAIVGLDPQAGLLPATGIGLYLALLCGL
jgi:hypothetical protein